MKILDAGSDVVSLRTSATKTSNGWILNGRKSWVTSLLEAKKAIVFATVDRTLKHKGITAFLVDLSVSGVHKGKSHNKMGIRATSTCDLLLDNVEISSSNVLL